MRKLLRVMTEFERGMAIRQALRLYRGKPMPDVFEEDAWPFGFVAMSPIYNLRAHSFETEIMAWCRSEYGSAMQLHQPPQGLRRRERHAWAMIGEGEMLIRNPAQAVELRMRWC